MSLKYNLVQNLLTSNPDDHSARPQGIKSHNLKSIISLMLKSGSTITHADITAVLINFFEVAGSITANGEIINTDLFKTKLSITGVFNSALDTFNRDRHAIKINTNPGKILKQAVAQMQVEKITTPKLIPNILGVKDSISGSIDNKITSGGILEIIGILLKISGDHVNNGVYFIGKDGTRNKVVTTVQNKPGSLIVMIPTLVTGEYTLELTTQYRGSSTLKTPRTGTFHKPLVVD